MEAKADYAFEMSWEVCNKVGGIYTVVASKINRMQEFYHKNYFTIGPDFPGRNTEDKFKEKDPPDFLKKAFLKVKENNIKCRFGKWRIDGEPNTILVEYTDFAEKNDEIKKILWDKFQIDSMGSAFHDYDEPMVWSTAVGYLIEEISKVLNSKKIVCHCHEWMSCGALLHLKAKNCKVGTIFTTHATMLGRTLASNEVDLYNVIDKINPEENAYRYGIQAKFLTEKASAHNASVFTTVSEITAIETKYLFGKEPDILVTNGLDIKRFPTYDVAAIKHKMLKNKVLKFLQWYFFPYYQFDLENTLIFFISGRYEFHDKGIDVFIKALADLNQHMKSINSKKTVVAFFWVPAGAREINPEILQNKSLYYDIDESMHDIIEELKDKVVYGLVGQHEINKVFLLGKELHKEIEKKLSRFKKEGNPPINTHFLSNDYDDPTVNSLKAKNLINNPDDKVKVIFYPIYLNGADQLLDFTYLEALMSANLGVFPSFYEPWGYTPLEAAAVGVTCVTTDLAGFGKYIKDHGVEKKNPGVFVLDRHSKSDDEVTVSLAGMFKKFIEFDKQERIDNSINAKKLSELADWKIMVENYIKAHNLAVERIS